MYNLKRAVARHRVAAVIIVLSLAVFFNCFGFPIYNFEKTWEPTITIEYFLLSVLSFGYIGSGLALVFPQKRYWFILVLLLALIGAGMVCRFLLEFGEVSNTYNFTLPNIFVHFFAGGLLGSLSWLYVQRYEI